MTLSSGTKLGPYEIRSPLGVGGMGEVYRARDSRLGRDVALKVLPEAFAADTERVARFEREAKVLASLNHPNIASIYGVEESNHQLALVMELVEGPTLAERTAVGTIAVDEALPIAKQVCEGLEYAHERGVVHRDLKPANVKVTPEGQVKILDFGLAKALDLADPATSDPSSSPTLTRMATHAGIILGTAAYMSPEQAKGKAVDRRTDIWAFGCLLYEMLTGKRAFDGESVSDTLANVIKEEPDWTALPPSVPPRIRALLKRCLTKDVKQRLQAIGDARITIDEVLAGSAELDFSATASGVATVQSSKASRILPWAVAGALAVTLLAVLIFFRSRTDRHPAPVMRLNLTADVRHLQAHRGSAVAISPDGTRIAYVSMRPIPSSGKGEDLVAPRAETYALFVRKLDQLEPVLLAETPAGTSPFFSPDGRWIGFHSDGAIKKVPSDGGPPLTVCEAPGILGASWGDDGYIYFAPSGVGEIRRVPEEGGTPATVVKEATTQGMTNFRWPRILPGGKAVLFTTSETNWLARHYKTEAYSLATGKRTVVLDDSADGRYLPGGYLVFLRGNVLMVARFDVSALKVTGPAVPVVNEVTGDEWFGSADYGLSSTGTLVYLTGGVQRDYRLVSADMAGKAEPIGNLVRGFEDLSVSPDGKQVAVTLVENATADVWVYNLQRDALSRLTQKGDCGDPLFSPDGSNVFYTNPSSLYVSPADGSRPAESLNTGLWAEPESFSAGGANILYSTFSPVNNEASLWLLPVKGGSPPTQVLPGIARVHDGRFSPDGRWLAYVSAQSGVSQVYLQAYPGSGERVQVSSDGGREPLWSPDGKQLYFRTPTKFLSADVKTAPELAVAKPRLLFEGNFLMTHHDYGLLPDGKHFILIQPVGKTPLGELHVVVNWAEELKTRLPAVGN
jgi:serine/threonine-protein kinase